MAAAILVRVTPELHREVARRAGLARVSMQEWVVRLLRAECGLPGRHRPTVTERIAAEWVLPGQEPSRAAGARRVRRAGEDGRTAIPSGDGAPPGRRWARRGRRWGVRRERRQPAGGAAVLRGAPVLPAVVKVGAAPPLRLSP